MTMRIGPGRGMIYLLLPLLFAAIAPVMLHAAPVSLKARLDSAYIIMGHKTNLHLEVVKDRKSKGHFPMFEDQDGLPYVTLNGDTIELSKKFTSDTVDLGSGRAQINYHVPLQAFDSGFYYLPPFKYIVGSDTAVSNRVALKVVPVNATAKDEIAGMTDVAEPEGKSIFDKVPDFLVNYWWVILLVILILAAGYIFYRKYMKNGGSLKRKQNVLPPYEEAVNALKALKTKQLWQNGDEDGYFTELTDILRRYISRRFGVAAPEMTSTQFLEEASRNEKLIPYKDSLRELLSIADFVKFAKMRSLPDENEKAFAISMKFVETTKPTPEEEQALKTDIPSEYSRPTQTGRKIKKQAQSSGRKRGSRGASVGNRTSVQSRRGKTSIKRKEADK